MIAIILTKYGAKLRIEDREKSEKEVYHVTWNVNAAEKDWYEDFMIKEIHEQNKTIRNTLSDKIELGKEITLYNIKFTNYILLCCKTKRMRCW